MRGSASSSSSSSSSRSRSRSRSSSSSSSSSRRRSSSTSSSRRRSSRSRSRSSSRSSRSSGRRSNAGGRAAAPRACAGQTRRTAGHGRVGGRPGHRCPAMPARCRGARHCGVAASRRRKVITQRSCKKSLSEPPGAPRSQHSYGRRAVGIRITPLDVA